MIPFNIKKWLNKESLPQRIILSGKSSFSSAISVAAHLQDVSEDTILKQIHPDTKVLSDDGSSIKIGNDQNEPDSIRGIIKWCHQSASSSYRIVILENLERASLSAPQALLKLIEEPHPQVQFLFTTKNHHRLLDTILSRMTVVRTPNIVESSFEDNSVDSFISSDNLLDKYQIIDDLVKISKDLKSKSNIHEFLEKIIMSIRNSRLKRIHLELVLDSYNAILHNANPKLVMERLAFKLTNR